MVLGIAELMMDLNRGGQRRQNDAGVIHDVTGSRLVCGKYAQIKHGAMRIMT